MNLLFLRGKVDERTECHNDLSRHTDMWTLLTASVVRKSEAGEMLYWGGKRFVQYTQTFFERWVKNLDGTPSYHAIPGCDGPFTDFNPDVIMARGGFKEYDNFLAANKDKCLVYYGAGRRFLPQTDKINYDVILVDSEEQSLIATKKHPLSMVKMFFKPAAETVFEPMPIEKLYDVCYVATIPTDPRKRVSWVHKNLPSDVKMLQLGQKPKSHPGNVKWRTVPRNNMALNMNMCKIGIVPYTEEDSGPRAISEFIACGLPVVISNRTRVWKSLFRDNPFVTFADDEDFFHVVKKELSVWKPEVVELQHDFYMKRLSLKMAAEHLRTILVRANDEKRSVQDHPVLRSI